MKKGKKRKTVTCAIEMKVSLPVIFDENEEPIGFHLDAIAPLLDEIVWNAKIRWVTPDEVNNKPIDPAELGPFHHTQKEFDALLDRRKIQLEEQNKNYWMHKSTT